MRMAHGAPLPVQYQSKGKKKSPNDKLNVRSTTKDCDLLSNGQSIRIARRFYVALMLSRLVQVDFLLSVCKSGSN